jgi:preprotein translocase subunit SecG
MFTAIIVVHILVSIVLIAVVLLQAGKGASIGAAFGGTSSQTLFGSAGPATFLGKMTAVCALIFMITSLSLTYLTVAKRTSTIMEDTQTIKEIPSQPLQEEPEEKPADNK